MTLIKISTKNFILNLAKRYPDPEDFIVAVTKLFTDDPHIDSNKINTDYYNIALILYENNLSSHAIKIFKRCIYNLSTLKDVKLKVNCFFYIGNSYSLLSYHHQAIEYYEMCLKIVIEIGDKDWQLILYVLLAQSCYRLLKFSKAIEFSKMGLKVSLEIKNKNYQLIYYIFLGDTYYTISDYKTAIIQLKNGLEISKELGDKMGERAGCMRLLGAAYCAISDYKTGIPYLENALEIAKEIGDKKRESLCYLNLGEAYNAVFEYKLSLKYYNNSLEKVKELGDKSGQLVCYEGLGDFYYTISDYKTAIVQLKNALEISKELGDKREEGGCCLGIGNLYSSLSDYRTAIIYLKRAFEIIKELGDKRGEAACDVSLGCLYIALYDYEKAFFHIDKSIENFEFIGFNILEQQHRVIFNTKYEIAYQLMVNVCLTLAESKNNIYFKYKAFEYVERSKSKIFLDLLSKTKQKGKGRQILSVKNIQKFLTDNKNMNCLIIEYFLTFSKLYIFIIDKNRYEVIEKSISYDKILNYIQNYFDEVHEYTQMLNNKKQPNNKWLELGNYLIKPINDLLQKNQMENTHDLIYFIPHSILHCISLHALPLYRIKGETQKAIIDFYKITYLPSSSMLQFYDNLKDDYHKPLKTCISFGVAIDKEDKGLLEEAQKVAELYHGHCYWQASKY